jgi:predicted permease
MIKVTGVYQNVNGAEAHTIVFVALSILTAAIALLPIIIIFFYQHRSRQVALGWSTILVIIGYSFWVAQTVKAITNGVVIGTNNMGIGLFLAPIAIVFIILAVKAIQRDEKLVRSADRLR